MIILKLRVIIRVNILLLLHAVTKKQFDTIFNRTKTDIIHLSKQKSKPEQITGNQNQELKNIRQI